MEAEPTKAKRPYTKLTPPPKLGTHDAAKDLIKQLAKRYPGSKPTDWRSVLATLNAAARHPKLWIELTRGE